MGTPETHRESHVLEYVLFRRNRPRIDLALADHGRSRTVLTRVYKRALSSIRVAACRNPSLFVGESHALGGADDPHLLWQIVRNGPLAELRAVCENAHLSSGFYVSLLASWRGDTNERMTAENRLSDERFQQVVRFLAHNKRISTAREESKERYYMDGYSDYQYNNFFVKCWQLASTVPVTALWAEALADLYATLVKPYAVFDDVPGVLERWRQPDEAEYSPMYFLRKAIAMRYVAPGPGALQSADPALRAAFYSSFDPDDPAASSLDWSEWLVLDKYCFLDLGENVKVWRSPRGRQKLRQLLWYKASADSNLTDVGFFDAREAEYRVTNPEWFAREVESVWDAEETVGAAPLAEAVAVGSIEAGRTEARGGQGPLWIAVAAFLGALLGAALF